jgi:multiple sugar transport system ATP-binding protein
MADIELTNVTKKFADRTVLSDISLSVRKGEFLTLLGPSGCGKSTLLRIVAGLDNNYTGSVAIGGHKADGKPPKERDIAMVFQSYALYPHMTVRENIALPLAMRRLSRLQRFPLLRRLTAGTAKRQAIDAEVESVARTLEIDALLDRKPAQLSGGQRQRVALARAIVRDPVAFLMDEPLSNLDAKLRVQMRAEIAQLHKRLGATFVYVTHDQAEAMTMSDRVAVMVDGRILQIGSAQQIYDYPASASVARYVGTPRINLLAGFTRADGAVDIAGMTLPVALPSYEKAKQVLVGVRPEGLRLAGRSGDRTFTGRIRLVEHMGSDIFVHLNVLGQEEPVIVREHRATFGNLRVDAPVNVELDPAQLLLFDRASGSRLPQPQPSRAAATA